MGRAWGVGQKEGGVNVLSLFTGVGGFDLGLERAGHTIVGQCEWDEKAQSVLRRHWPDVPLHGDISTLDKEWLSSVGILGGNGGKGGRNRVSGGSVPDPEIGGKRRQSGSNGVDLVCGGFPCQDLSVAGKRAGLAGERSGLFFEAARISDAVLPTGGWVLIENVPGLLSSNGGRDFALVLASLADLGFYDLAWRVLDSQYFGVPQRRRRVFILARRARGRRAAQVLCEPEGGGGDSSASGKAGKAPAETFGVSVAGPLGATTHKRPDDLDEHGAYVGSPPDPDRVRAPSGVPGRMDDSVTAFHATQTPISGSISPALGSNAQIGVTGGGPERLTCAYDPKPDGPRYAQMGNAVTVNVAEWIGDRLARFA
jgi:DNA (cytosine-5)-methyltransferase 1